MAKERRTFFTADWFPLYVERFEESDHVALMNCTVEGAYFRAIRRAWKKRSLPANVEVFAAKVRCSVAAAKKVLATFVPDPDDPKRVIHPVVEEIRAEQEQKYLNRRKGGIASRKSAKKSAPVNAGNKDSSSITQQCSSITQTRIENKERREESLNNLEKENNLEHTQVRAGEKPERQEEQTLPVEVFLGTVEAGLCKRLHVRSLPSRDLWHRHLRWAFANHFTSEDVLECFDLLKAQDWRTSTITAKTLVENLPTLATLRGGNGKRPHSEPKRISEIDLQRRIAQENGPRRGKA